jgi:hypothetical protein
MLATTLSLTNYLCRGQDLRLSTAALMSARFPYVSPAGRLTACNNPGASAAARKRAPTAAYVVDGGYYDGSGDSPVTELWSELGRIVAAHNRSSAGPCVIPLFIQLDNHYASVSAPTGGAPSQIGVPPEALASVHGTRDDEARQLAASLFDVPVGAANGKPLAGWAHVYPRAHPASEPPLGWALSSESIADMSNELHTANKGSLAQISAWFTHGDLSCQLAPGEQPNR